jgi:Arc/MetJ-type ribon-helix-helix transcriptional regulator
MVFGMATTKITITLDNDQLEGIRALVAAGAAANVSAFVKHAVGVALFDAAGWREMLEDALQQTGGPLMKKERAWADALLSPHGQKRGFRKGMSNGQAAPPAPPPPHGQKRVAGKGKAA